MIWNKSDIRRARKVDLAPVLRGKGLHLKPLLDDNFLVVPYYDLFVKKSFWRWPSRNLSGNSIDFFIRVQGLSFNETMKLLSQYLPAQPVPAPEILSPP